MNIKQSTAFRIEQSEARGKIEIDTLRRAAQALDCTLIYALYRTSRCRRWCTTARAKWC